MCFTVCSSGGTGDFNQSIDLGRLRNKQVEFQYTTLKWGSTPEEVQKQFPYTITDKTAAVYGVDAEVMEDGIALARYQSTQKFTLDTGTATARLELYSGKLQNVVFDFWQLENHLQWFAAQEIAPQFSLSICAKLFFTGVTKCAIAKGRNPRYLKRQLIAQRCGTRI